MSKLITVLTLAILAGCSTTVPHEQNAWPSECGVDEYTDYCLEGWEMNKYGRIRTIKEISDE